MDLIGSQGPLAATLYPGKSPGLVFACGSGLADQEGNDQDVGFAPLGQLAQQLIELGLASLRFDRQGVGGSPGSFAGPEQTVADLLAVVEQARALLGPDLILVGHGEGAGLATLAATRTPCQGLILLAPPATFVRDLIEYASLAENTLLDTPPDDHRAALAALQDHYRERKHLFLFRPVLQVTCPILLIHGTMDWVFPTAESEQIACELTKIDKPPTLAILPDLDHWLVQTQTYRDLRANLQPHWLVDRRVAQTIRDWWDQCVDQGL